MTKPDSCQTCPLYASEFNFVPPERAAETALIVEGEAPGETENERRRPFCGKSGYFLRYLILDKMCGIPIKKVSFQNVLQCLPGKGKDSYPRAAIAVQAEACCRQHRISAADAETPVLSLGAHSLAQWTNGKLKMGDYHGHIHIKQGRVVGHTYHPAAILREMNYLPVVVSEIQNFWKAAHNKQLLKRPRVVREVPDISRMDSAVVDLEWDDLRKITVVGMASSGDAAFSSYDTAAGMRAVNQLVRNGTTIIGHNIIDADLKHIDAVPKSFGPAHIVDTMIVAHIVHAHLAQLGLYDLGSLCRMYFPCGEWKSDNSDLLAYNAYDCAYNWRLYEGLMRDACTLKAEHLIEPEQELAYLTTLMHERGIHIDTEALATESDKKADARAWADVNLPFNPRSPKQVVDWFKDNGIKINDMQFTTLEKALKRRPDSRELQALVGYRNDAKSISTWFPEEGRDRIYPEFHATGTSVARLSSSGPNFQNLPPSLRHIITASPGNILVSFDGSQIEARFVAFEAKETRLLDAFRNPGFDLHEFNSNNMTQCAGFAVDRQDGKITSHATNYGETAYNLALRMFGNSKRESILKAERLQDAYFASYPRIKAWQFEVGRKLDSGDVLLRNVWGRPRFIYAHEARDRVKRGCHFLGCSGAADFVNRCAVEIWKQAGLVPIMIVHDELVYDVPPSDLATLEEAWRAILERPVEALDGLVIPWNMKVGKNYGKFSNYNAGGLQKAA